MFLQSKDIQKGSTVSDIVSYDHRTADIFRKYGIEYCCGGRWPLETVCVMKGLEFEQLKDELAKVSRSIQVSPLLAYDTWSLDFLTNYIINVHHFYLRSVLPSLGELIREFSEEHRSRYANMVVACDLFEEFKAEISPHLDQEEEIIFPYVCRLIHAYQNKDPYAKLLVKTLRKPLELMMQKDREMVSNFVFRMRELTNEYSPPEKACVSHRVVFSKLRELDNDLNQHVYLESEVLFPRALTIEKELLSL